MWIPAACNNDDNTNNINDDNNDNHNNKHMCARSALEAGAGVQEP